MEKIQLLSQILDSIDDVCYVSDPETYDLVYINKAGRQAISTVSSNCAGKCYRVLQQLEEPCDFCTNHLLDVGRKYVWERYNSYIQGYFVLTDTFIQVDGKKLRLELARNITEYKDRQQKLEHKLTLEENLVACVECLASGLDIAGSLNRLLSIVGEYYQADRAYIFEIDYEHKIIHNSYEWCRAGVSPEINNLKRIPLAAVKPWLERFQEQGAFIIPALSALSPDSLDYQILEPQGIKSLMATPLTAKGKIVGFLGVDNPTDNCAEMRLLCAVPFFIQDELVKRRMLEQLEWLSFRDILTGFHNRNKYATMLNEIMDCPPKKLGIVYVDVNGLKAANDTYGHEHGDQIIRRVAAHIKAALEGEVYRIGGDEFVALCPDMDEPDFAEMVNALRARVDEDEAISISIGSSWSNANINAMELVKFADDRMYADKQNYYKSQLAVQTNRKTAAVRQLHQEIEAGEFVVLLQPQIDLQTNALVGAEAFVRKQSAGRQLLPPDKFLPLYELEGIVRHLDFHVLETVCTTLKDWKKDGAPLPVTVNLSRMTLMESTVIADVSELCRAYDLDPSCLRIKVSRSACQMDVRFLKGLTVEFQRKGFEMALGGFCSEASNISLLATIDFNEVHFDRNFINKIEANPKHQVILEHALTMFHSLGATRSLAEGVETARQMEFLKEKHCEYGQGYFFSEPLDLAGFKLLRQNWPARNT